MDRPRDWIAAVNEPHTGAELDALRACIARGIPFGSERWKTETADRLGLTAALEPIGRPRKKRSPKKVNVTPFPPRQEAFDLLARADGI